MTKVAGPTNNPKEHKRSRGCDQGSAAQTGANTLNKRTAWLTVILLSFFDGMGTAAQAPKELGVAIFLYLSWEIDEDCIQLVSKHHPERIQPQRRLHHR